MRNIAPVKLLPHHLHNYMQPKRGLFITAETRFPRDYSMLGSSILDEMFSLYQNRDYVALRIAKV
jgi:hypothetical protein